MRASGLAALLALALAAAAAPGFAEVRRLEVVGVAPAGADAKRKASVRDQALGSAIEEGVERVARELLEEPLPPEDLAAALGDPGAYAVSYRILEDRGERRALLLRPEVATEYVLLVEVHVDATRIERALARAGRLGVRGPGRRFRVLLEDPASYAVYERVRQGLVAAGARRAVPLEFRPGEVLLVVDAPAGPERLLERLVRASRRGGSPIRVVEVDGSLVRLRAD